MYIEYYNFFSIVELLAVGSKSNRLPLTSSLRIYLSPPSASYSFLSPWNKVSHEYITQNMLEDQARDFPFGNSSIRILLQAVSVVVNRCAEGISQSSVSVRGPKNLVGKGKAFPVKFF
jgi:hypothetical protein